MDIGLYRIQQRGINTMTLALCSSCYYNGGCAGKFEVSVFAKSASAPKVFLQYDGEGFLELFCPVCGRKVMALCLVSFLGDERRPDAPQPTC